MSQVMGRCRVLWEVRRCPGHSTLGGGAGPNSDPWGLRPVQVPWRPFSPSLSRTHTGQVLLPSLLGCGQCNAQTVAVPTWLADALEEADSSRGLWVLVLAGVLSCSVPSLSKPHLPQRI